MSDNKGSDTGCPENRQRIPDVSSPQPFENLLSQIVSRIKDDLFLFAIAAIVLIVAAIVLGSGLGSSFLRFTIAVIALLALAAIVIRFAGGRGSRPSPQRKQQVTAKGGGMILGSTQSSELPVDSQSILVDGENSAAVDVHQTSGAISPHDRAESDQEE